MMRGVKSDTIAIRLSLSRGYSVSNSLSVALFWREAIADGAAFRTRFKTDNLLGVGLRAEAVPSAMVRTLRRPELPGGSSCSGPTEGGSELSPPNDDSSIK